MFGRQRTKACPAQAFGQQGERPSVLFDRRGRQLARRQRVVTPPFQLHRHGRAGATFDGFTRGDGDQQLVTLSAGIGFGPGAHVAAVSIGQGDGGAPLPMGLVVEDGTGAVGLLRALLWRSWHWVNLLSRAGLPRSNGEQPAPL